MERHLGMDDENYQVGRDANCIVVENVKKSIMNVPERSTL